MTHGPTDVGRSRNFSGIDGSADIGLELFQDRVLKPPDWLEFGMLLGLGTLPKKCSGSRDGVPRPQELAWVLEHFLERVPMPRAAFQSLGQIECHQASEPFPENVPGPGMVFQGLRNLLGSRNISWKEFRCLWQNSKALGTLNSTRSRNLFWKMSLVLGWSPKSLLGSQNISQKSSKDGSLPRHWAN